MLTIQQRLASALAGCTVKEWHTLAPRASLFEADPMAVKLFDFMSTFVREHGRSPSLATINEKFGIQLKQEEAEREFLLSRAQETRVKRRLALVTADLQATMQTDPIQALKVLHEECGGLIAEMTQTKVYDFKQAIEQAWPWLVAKWTGQIPSVPIFWPSLQAQMGGVQGGEVFSVIGRPGMGKTWLMLSLAMHIWEQLNRPVIFVSMEIMRRNLMTRAASLYSGVAADWFKHGDTPTLYGQDKKKKVHQLLTQLQKSDKASFYVVDGNLTASTTDVVELCRAHEPCAVFVDGAYMLKVPSNRGLKGHEKIEEITSVLKRDVATGMDIPVFASWQFNRDATKVKKDQTPSLEHIAGGDFIGFISSVVVGLLDAPEEVAGNAKHAGRRRLQILKGRDGETGEMLLNWDFAGMDFREIDPDSQEAKTTYGIDEFELEDAA